MNSLHTYLATFNLPEIQINKISSIFNTKITLNKGDYFHTEGHIANQIGFILTGMCRYFYLTEKKEVTRWVGLSNEFVVSLGSFITQTKSRENIQALELTEILVATKEDFQILYNEYDFVRNFWIKNIEANYIGFETRVFNLIALTAEERYKWMLIHQPQFNLLVPDKYVASMLGIKPRHLSRIRGKKK